MAPYDKESGVYSTISPKEYDKYAKKVLKKEEDEDGKNNNK